MNDLFVIYCICPVDDLLSEIYIGSCLTVRFLKRMKEHMRHGRLSDRFHSRGPLTVIQLDRVDSRAIEKDWIDSARAEGLKILNEVGSLPLPDWLTRETLKSVKATILARTGSLHLTSCPERRVVCDSCEVVKDPSEVHPGEAKDWRICDDCIDDPIAWTS